MTDSKPKTSTVEITTGTYAGQTVEYRKTPWIPVADVPTKPEEIEKLAEMFGTSGVYQVAMSEDIDEIGDDIVHEKIGYTGKSTNVVGRTYVIRMPSGDHGASRYIRQNNLDRKTDVKLRYLYTEDQSTLERGLHNMTKEKFGYDFKWREASGGTDGVYSQVLDLVEKYLTTDQILDMIPELKKFAVKKNQQEFMDKLREV